MRISVPFITHAIAACMWQIDKNHSFDCRTVRELCARLQPGAHFEGGVQPRYVVQTEKVVPKMWKWKPKQPQTHNRS